MFMNETNTSSALAAIDGAAPATAPAQLDAWGMPMQAAPAIDDAASATVTAPPQLDPWGMPIEGAPAAAPADPWEADTQPTEAVSGASDWLDAPTIDTDAVTGFQIQQLWDGSLPVESWINQGLDWVVDNFRPFFQTVRAPIDSTLTSVEGLLQSVPSLAMIAFIGLLAWQFAGRALAIGAVVSLLLVVMLGIWPEAMVTLSLVLTSLAFCLVVGLPMGILLASSDRAMRLTRPLLDAMQTTPAFVYLVPVVMLFGIGNVPGVIVTIIFALPPLIRLTNLGIRQVRPDLIEAARAYGASPLQLLTKVQLPLAMPSIMAGVNQTLMLSLSMVVIAGMVGAGGLGAQVVASLNRIDVALGFEAGLAVVILAIFLDRLTAALGTGDTPLGRFLEARKRGRQQALAA